ncbi:site-2 protease family protein [Candidatus Wolfebacteria bacterium]|nr:site-2 protease family protein [Candidatus Wolfebacteria bacterium]
MESLFSKLFLYIIIILSATFHEFAHGLMAYRLGDTTAKDQGRLTLNPLKHLDPLGTVIIPLFLLFTGGIFIGWARPVPYNPSNLSDQRYGSLKVGLAGPSANLIIAFVLGLILRFFSFYLLMAGFINPLFLEFVSLIVYINIVLALFNLIPFPPLDGSKILFDLFPATRKWLESIGFIGIFLALSLSFYFISPIARLIFRLIVGGSQAF